MPRPGPRPYECVRRAWHSDRHQPIRGSLIQEIFRIVNEIHSSATKKNKEWQEKLPIVVLKSEEIMYSKANSEAEYVDVGTLWSRVNDAINTIIRRDESTETGELLQPCIEAALQLGCPARRASRSQRNNNTPRFYLNNPEKNKTFSIPPQSLLLLPPTSSNSQQLKFPISPNSFTPNVIQQQQQHIKPCSSIRFSSSSPYSVYPLYYGNQFQSADYKFRTTSSSCEANNRKSELKKLTFCEANDAKDVIFETPPGNGCDLSLRLVPLVVPCLSAENNWPQEVEDGGFVSTSKVGTKKIDLSSKNDKEFSFFPSTANSTHHMFHFSPMVQNLSSEEGLRKRKMAAVSHHPSSEEDRQLSWPLKFPFKQHFNGSISNAGP